MYKCIINGQEVIIDSEQALEELLANGTVTGRERATNTESGKEGVINQTKWFHEIIKRNPNIIKPSKSSKIIGIICTILGGILVLIAAYIEFVKGGSTAAIGGSIMGTVIGAILFPGIIFGVVYVLKKKKPGIFLFGILFFVFSLAGLSAGIDSVKKSHEQYANFNDKVVEMQQHAANIEDWEPCVFDDETYGEFSELGEMTQDYLMAYTQINKELLSDVQDVSAESVLSTSVLGSHSKIKETIAKIEQFEDQFGVYKSDTKDLEADFLNKLDALGEFSRTAKGFKKGFLKGLETSHVETTEIFEKTSQMIKVTKEILEFLEAREGLYEVDDEQILFTRDSDVKQYNDLIDKLNKIGEELTSLGSETESTTGQ